MDGLQRHLEESHKQQEEAELSLGLQLRECEEELARQAAMPAMVKVANDKLNPLSVTRVSEVCFLEHDNILDSRWQII